MSTALALTSTGPRDISSLSKKTFLPHVTFQVNTIGFVLRRNVASFQEMEEKQDTQHIIICGRKNCKYTLSSIDSSRCP